MENLYGQGSESAPPSSEECDAGESLSPASGRGLGGRMGGGVGWGRAGVEPELRGVYSAGCLSPEEVDTLLQRCEGGVDAALQYAKNMAKYMKDLIGYLEKRSTLGESWSLQGGVWLEGPSAPLPSHSFPCRDGLRQRPAEDRPELQTECHAGGGELGGSVWVGGAPGRVPPAWM